LPHISIEGPAGLLEARIDGEGDTAMVLCHPHPLYGGSMDDLVLEAMARAATKCGISVLRFNFRGVGHSEGVHGGGKGEVDDVLAAVNWLFDQGYRSVDLAGYSFGAVMALRAAAKKVVNRLLLVAPPVSMLQGVPLPALPICVVIGDEDQFVDASGAAKYFDEGAQLHVVPHADHFFHGYHDQITGIFDAFLASKGS